MRTRVRRQQCPIIIDLDADLIKSKFVASESEQPINISIKVRENGWQPYKVRFDDSQAAWIVSAFQR